MLFLTLLALVSYQPLENVTLAIEVAGKGPKLTIVDENFKPYFIDTRSASSLRDMANGIMTDDSMTLTTVAVAELLIKGKEKAKEQNWHIKNTVIVASSSITAQKNYKTLFSQIECATGLKVLSVTAQYEARLIFQATVPAVKRIDSLIVDVGSGNSRLAWVDEDDKLKEITIPLGTVTATNLMQDLDKTVFQNKIRDLVKIPLPKKQVVYFSGGIAWALQTIIDSPTQLYTPIDIAKLRALDLTNEYNKIAKTENKMTRVFTLPNLLAGSHLLFSILDNFTEDQRFIFVNNQQSWIVDYLREQAVNK